MRVRNRFALLALVASTLAMTSPATGEGWFREMDKARDATLGDILRNPRAYVDVDVKVKMYFNAPGGAYNPYFTRFTEEMYGNFSAWPIDARLYEKRDYQRSYHFFFIKRVNPVWKKIQKVETLTAIEVHATVREVFRGQAWIEVFDFETVSEGLTAAQVRNVVAGDAYYYAGRYSEAARRYDRAVSSRQSDEVQADIYRRLADARFSAGDYRGALSSYRDALDNEPDSTVLQRGAAAAEAAVARSKGRGEAGAEELLPAPRNEPVTGKQTSVDAIINLLEDPTHVQAEVEAWHLELEKRAARARGDVGVEAVSGTDTPTVEDAPQPETAPVDGCSPEIVEEPAVEAAQPEITVPESGGKDETDESGCGHEEACGCEAEEAPEATHVREPFVTEPPVEDASEETVDTEETEAEEATDTDAADDMTDATDVEETTESAGDATETADDAVDTTDAVATDESAGEACGTESAEGCGDTPSDWVEVPADETAEGMESDESSEGCASEEEVVWEEESTDETMEGCGEEVVVVEAGDETETSDPRIVRVADVVVRLTRLPFFGCEEVTLEDWRAVVEEIVLNPEN